MTEAKFRMFDVDLFMTCTLCVCVCVCVTTGNFVFALFCLLCVAAAWKATPGNGTHFQTGFITAIHYDHERETHLSNVISCSIFVHRIHWRISYRCQSSFAGEWIRIQRTRKARYQKVKQISLSINRIREKGVEILKARPYIYVCSFFVHTQDIHRWMHFFFLML